MSRPDTPLVVFDGIDKTYDGSSARVVEDLHLSVARGEFLTLLGPSGSGKTTILMMLAGFEAPSRGTILFDGKPLDDLPAWKRDFGIVFQNYALFPHMTVAQNLAFPLRMRRIGKAQIARRVAQTLEMVQLGPLRDRMPAQLSGGQQQRVALARALVFQPRMVLMDEPLGALDKQLREQMQLEIKRLHAELGIAVLYVTHDQSEALTMSDRIAVFDQGRIQQIGPPREVYANPASPFVAAFMGENNRLQATVDTVDATALTVRSGASLLRAHPPREALTDGQPVILMLRPECIELNAPEGCDNRTRGEIREVVYHGDHLRLSLAVAGLGTLVARQAIAPDGTEYRPGQSLQIGWSSHNLHAFPG